jgi:uncharacterized glyoxalase superfamily protein PhnB
MKFGYSIIYVDDVKATLEFYGRAFGLQIRFLHESNQYGELETGATALAFASSEMGEINLPGGYVRVSADGTPLGFEIALVTDDVAGAFDRAVAAGATAIAPATAKPWGQTVAYVRSAEGTVIELCTPIG